MTRPHHSSGSEDKEKFYCEEVTASVADIERKMGQLHADLINAEMDRPASIPPDEPYVDLGIIGEQRFEFDDVRSFQLNLGEPRTPVKNATMDFPPPPKEFLE